MLPGRLKEYIKNHDLKTKNGIMDTTMKHAEFDMESKGQLLLNSWLNQIEVGPVWFNG